MLPISPSESEKITLTTSAAASAVGDKKLTIRVSSVSYLAVFFIGTYVAGLLIYLERDLAAAIICLSTWALLPLLSVTDKIIYDGKYLYRSGILYKIWQRLNKHPERLKISEIELIETQAIRTLQRGGKVVYRYRTTVSGLNQNLVFLSGSEDYRRMITKLFRVVDEESLDLRSIELREFYCDSDKVFRKAALARIPSVEVLENSIEKIRHKFARTDFGNRYSDFSVEKYEKAQDLRVLANQLKISGSLVQSLEAFRRALFIKPDDAELIFEFARCLHSYANSRRSAALKRKANAALRLAGIKSAADSNLHALIGETYFQTGDFIRAKNSFKKSNLLAENFRALRGLAEIALREGKIAYVIMHLQNALESAQTAALKNWAQREKDYYELLNNDESYMDSEVKRIRHLEIVDTGRKFVFKFVLSGMFIALLGAAIEPTLANFGWIISSLAILGWVLMIFLRRMLLERTPYLPDDE